MHSTVPNNYNLDSKMNDNERDDELEETPVYVVDNDTTALIETALNCMITLSDAQVDPASGEALVAIADELALRFAINRYEVVETVHTDEDGTEEVIYSPQGGLRLGDEDEDEDQTDEEHTQ